MIDTIIHWFQYLVGLCYFINPFLMIFATCMWVGLKYRMDKKLQLMYLRCYALEKQIDFVVDKSDLDIEFYHYMKKNYRDLEDEMDG